MKTIYADILEAKAGGQKLLAILLDPDKVEEIRLGKIIEKINASPATHIFVGGSEVKADVTRLVAALKSGSRLPVVLFPGNPSQIAPNADAILFLSLLSGRNPDFLIGHQTKAAPLLRQTNLEIIPTAYLLIESGAQTAVSRVSQTSPMPVSDIEKIVHTAQAGEMLGKKLAYLEAGIGAKNPVSPTIIKAVSEGIGIPVIAGGGIRSASGIETAFASGADMVVIGTAFENNPDFFAQMPPAKAFGHA
jgi:putative glycerol-1-phosphate prenyltransferase